MIEKSSQKAPNMEAFWLPKFSQNPSWPRLGSHFGSPWGHDVPKMPPRPPKISKMTRKTSKMMLTCSQNAPKMLPKCSQNAPNMELEMGPKGRTNKAQEQHRQSKQTEHKQHASSNRQHSSAQHSTANRTANNTTDNTEDSTAGSTSDSRATAWPGGMREAIESGHPPGGAVSGRQQRVSTN